MITIALRSIHRLLGRVPVLWWCMLNAAIVCDPNLLALRSETIAAPLFPMSEFLVCAGMIALVLAGQLASDARVFAIINLLLSASRFLTCVARPPLIGIWMNVLNGSVTALTVGLACCAMWLSAVSATGEICTLTPSAVLGIAIGVAIFGGTFVLLRYAQLAGGDAIKSNFRLATSKQLSSDLVARCRMPSDVEILARTSLNSKSIEDVVAAIAIFDAGLDRFPNKPELLMAYARFVLFVLAPLVDEQLTKTHNEVKLRCLGQMNSIAKTLESMWIPLDLQFFAYCIISLGWMP